MEKVNRKLPKMVDKPADIERVKCWICPAKFFDSEQQYQEHTERIHQGYRYRCEECEEEILFKDIEDARYHVDENHDINMQQCPSCEESFNEYNLRKHLQDVHQQTRQHRCDLCEDKKFEDQNDYENHIQNEHQGFRVKCPICHRMLKTKLRTHTEYIHSDGTAKCNICDKQYSNKYKLIRHLKSHTDPVDPGAWVRCERCNESFESISKLNDHKTKHQTKVNQCDICSKMFYRNGALIQHLKSHEYKFSCNVCIRFFNSEANLRRHMDVHEVGNQSKRKRVKEHLHNHKCDICGKEFADEHELETHIVSHTSDQSFFCQLCNQGFETRKALYNHMRIKNAHDHLLNSDDQSRKNKA